MRNASSKHQRISINQVRPGMYVVGLDRSWLKTPFLFHQRLIRNDTDIDKLQQAGVQTVTINPSKGTAAPQDTTRDGNSPTSLPSAEQREPQQPADTPQDFSSAAEADPRKMSKAELETYLTDPKHFPTKADLLTFAREYNVAVTARTPRQEILRMCLRMLHDIPQGFQALRSIAKELPAASTAREQALVTAQTLFSDLQPRSRIDGPAIRKAVGGLLDSILRSPQASLLLTQMQQFDSSLFVHGVNTCTIALVVGKQQGLDRQQLSLLGIGALLHDVGQTRLPAELIKKPGRYTDQERKLAQDHVHLGFTLLSQAKQIPEAAIRLVAEHHERLDGSGYPKGLKGKSLSALSQIVGVTDIYDTLVSGRSGASPTPPTLALRELYQLGATRKFDLEVVEWVVRTLGVYPVGTLIELDTGERGVVMAVNPTDSLRPIVRLIWDTSQQPYLEPLTIDLAAPPPAGQASRTIVQALDPVAAQSGSSLSAA
jgi:HD-GYP domain-containing protein (c-di-GMP phosphodiesterase class II)